MWSDPQTLGAAITDFVSRGAVTVPPYPAVAMKIEELVRREDFGLDELARLVASDQSLAADALRCANSSFYSRGNAVTSIKQAIARIGAQEVARLAIASGLGAHAHAQGPLAPLRRRIWLEALAVAGLCQELAKHRGLPSEEAFVCGLLHDFGKVIAAGCIEELLASAPEPQEPLPLEHWLGVMERYHVQLGLVLAARWKLPPVVTEVLSQHHEPDPGDAGDRRLVELVRTADAVVRLLDERNWVGPDDLVEVPLLSREERELVPLVLARLPEFIASFEGVTTALPPAGSPVVQQPAGQSSAGPVPLDCPAKVTLNRQELAYRATGIGERNLFVRGPAPLPENLLLSVELIEPPLRCWAVAKLSWPDGGDHVVLLQPFALDDAARRAWRALLDDRLAQCGPLAEPVWAVAQEIAVDVEPADAPAPARPAGLLGRLWGSLTSGGRTSPADTASRRS
jgi:putative nucleotidyltransferase with HDIG domain